MPEGDPWDQIHNLLALEKFIRLGAGLDTQDLQLPDQPYWRDLALLLFAYKLTREGRTDALVLTASKIESRYFRSIVQERADRQSSRKVSHEGNR